MNRKLLALSLVAALVPASAAHGAAAPGRVAYPVSTTGDDEEFPAVSAAVATADGGVITAGAAGGRGPVVLARLREDGSLDQSFGTAGLSRLPTSTAGMSSATPRGVLAGPGGAVYVVARGPVKGAGSWAPVVIRVGADGRVDPTFGTRGAAIAGIDESSAAGAAVQPDGAVLVGGSVSTVRPPGGAASDPSGALTRLTPTGAPDPTFGTAGVVVLPGRPAGPVAVLADGSIAVAMQRPGSPAQLIVLRPDGGIDPSFNGGQPLGLGDGRVGGIVTRPEGGMDVIVDPLGSGAARVRRLRRDGSLDPAFGTNGSVDVVADPGAAGLLPAPGGAELVTSTESGAFGLARLRVARLLPDGRPDPAWGGANGRLLSLPLHGGVLQVGNQPLARALHEGVKSTVPVARANGGLLVAASVQLDGYGGDGPAAVHREVGVAAYQADLAPDAAWGTPRTRTRLALHLPRTSARDIARSGRPQRMRLVMTAATAGTVEIDVLLRGRVVARGVAAAFGGRETAYVPLTSYGRRTIGRAAGARLTLRGRLRDVVGATARTTVRARLR